MVKEIIKIMSVKARDIQEAMIIIKKKYRYARMITYKFDKNFIFDRPKNYADRTMQVAFVTDCNKVWEIK